ncbi:hypothetical protein DTO013E5_886 [Penicillium roqueforti]|uniref:uncharacterized protein n=1 Tax=Penicillium roqueforti TaxID=5082 RepID=UPI00190BE5D0|nr:uncharacterized protein LCP9604111_2088 [Penicillium roqueforti]KAF9252092.1 hypothetical protein LCP9604111_2088 [Penicillium roqueforti]KAI1837361.1 hypothetical protein CBS147337_1644 [Penicillium roqueforti]KAI2689831.1 hypothetical protein CBS147355_282 [Penicillium roqueforti]KAI2702370.1 hypothetical protein CBS147372_4103 [Penicillium roqueforti]KAI2728220.1 hypothetical protein CBS147354_2753 [Penicillium roqueforti]
MIAPLSVVYDGVRKPEIDLVSIPGLPTIHPTYKLKDHTKWLREVLSHQVPQARIMAFQYDFAKDSMEVSWAELFRNVEYLLYSLVHRREGTEDRPVLFICYSFGAIILKKALLIAKKTPIFRNILDKTRGIIFLGCLNDESNPQIEELCLKCAAVELGVIMKNKMIDTLRKTDDWTIIRDVIESFRVLRCRFPVRNLYELRPTNIMSRTLGVKKVKREMLCDLRVSSLGWSDEDCVGIEKDHGELTMYPLRSDEDGYFETFMRTLTRMIDEIVPRPTQQAWERNDPDDDQNWLVMEGTSSNRSANLEADITKSMLSYNDSASFHTSHGTHIPCYVMTPFEDNPNFVGREKTLTAIHDALAPGSPSVGQRVFALTGLGGMGKTQTAVRYAFSQMEVTYKIVLWAHADGQSKLSESFSLFASELGLGDGLTHAKAKQAVKDYLAIVDVDWLMIFDNADGDDKTELLAEFWPRGDKGSILITSRDKTLTNRYHGRFLKELHSKNAVDLLLKLTGMPTTTTEERLAAREIVKRVGFLPLGINQAANLIINLSCTFSEFLGAYDLQELIEDSSDVQLISGGSYKYSLRTVWNMNFEKLSSADQALLKMISFLDPDRIQMKLLLEGGAESANPNLHFINTSYKVTKCRAGLLRSSLISQNERKDELQMHRLVQAYCQLKVSPEEAQQSFGNAISLVKQVWPVPPRSEVHNPSLWERQRALLPHVQKLYVVNWDFPSVVYEASWFCYESGMLESVSDLLNPAKDYCIQHLASGRGYRLLADIYGCFGSLCTESNQFQGAYDNFATEWKYLEKAFEAGELERPSIWEVFGLGRLGNGHHGLHQYAEAEAYYRKALAAWENLPGDKKLWHSHLATCLWLQGRPDEGEVVVRGVIKDENDTTNFRTAMAMYALGNIQIAQATGLTLEGKKKDAEDKLAEAMNTHVKVLNLWTKTLGPRHHKTSDAMYKVGWHLHRRQEYAQALDMFERALDIYESQPHLYKNEIARTKYKIGCLKQDTQHHSDGAALIREADRIRQQIVPPEDWEPAKCEEDFDNIVQFWTR